MLSIVAANHTIRGVHWALGVSVLSVMSLWSVDGASAQIEKDDWSLQKESKLEQWSPPSRFGDGGVLSVAFVGPGRARLAVVGEESLKRSDVLRRVLRFYRRQDSRLLATHRFTTSYYFVTMWADVLGGRVFTTWASGSAYRTGIFALSGDEVRLVLWLGWKWPPQFVDLDGDGEEEIVYGVNGYAGAASAKAEIYKWTGRDYVLVKTVPWSARFDRLTSP